MELKDFVAQTILAISSGIIDAQAKSKDSGLIIAPPLTESGNIQKLKNGIKKPNIIHFNLKVVAEVKNEKGKGGGGFSLEVINIKISSESGSIDGSSAYSSELQEISFDIPVLWPTNAEQIEPQPQVNSNTKKYNPLDY